jgi:hypothetical protein
MSQIKIPSAPLTVSKINVGNSTWVMLPDKNSADMILRRVALLPGTGSSAFDGREYLEAFMAVREPEDALTFVNRFGDPSMSGLGAITFRDFKDLQNMVRIATRTPLSEWPPKDLSIESAGVRYLVSPEMGGHLVLNPWRLELRWDMTPPVLVHQTYAGIEACCAQVFFEKLSGVEFRWCARADCGTMFRKETGHDKIYCTPDCAHLAAVRASRARANRTSLKKRSRKRR